MAAVRKNIVISDAQDRWIKTQIESGRYASYSECIRALIHRDQERSDVTEAIRSALIAGEESGEPIRFDPDAFNQYMSDTN
ncbi:type II toxin-antitoxin system ParD family antitoxin [Pseudomonas syringae]|uniref:type II toxin-antitoxin system ParD family antitoxin n=1 Tax=Pseudomonas syringae TaxID=317 RepID=UPI000515A1CF|nr:type II toxin-antitoxin system ParD family antitoxin [Pseudomonas syringae]